MGADATARADDPDPPSWQPSLAHSLRAARSATILRIAKATLLFTLAGAAVFALALPLLLDRPHHFFGLRIGPEVAAPLDPASLDALEARLRDEALRADGWHQLSSRLAKTEELLQDVAARTMVALAPFSIALGSVRSPDASVHVARVEVTPVAIDRSGLVSTYVARSFDFAELAKPQRLFDGAAATTRELQFQVACLGAGGERLAEDVLVFHGGRGRSSADRAELVLPGVTTPETPLVSFEIKRQR